MEIVLDASAIIAFIADEPEAQIVINYTKNAAIVSPNIISSEIANALTRMMKKKIITSEEQMLNLIKNFKLIPMKLIEIDLEKALQIAWQNNLYAYDAFYLEIAKRLRLPLITFDTVMAKIGKTLGLNILGG
ncbi:MAG: type II toxin-antitoxin system VapC family toxin [Treponema sp.]|nr:type II toxin-antitoxin system VapC family toxin [Treponema sp.]